MPKNNKGGKKFKRSKNFGEEDRQLMLPEGDTQIYAKVLKKLGDCRFELKCFDGLNRIGKVRGKMRKRVWIEIGDYVLVSTRNFENEQVASSETVTETNKADIFHRYTPEEVRVLKREAVYKFSEPKDDDFKPKTIDYADSGGEGSDCAFDFEDI